MPRSILTEMLSRRGYHLSREYGVDPLEMVSVADVMTEHSADAVQTEDALQDLPEVLAYSDETCRAVAEEMATTGVMSMPVVDRESGLVIGSISAQELLSGRRHAVVRESERSRSFQLQARRK
jgi:predicted transcriptional regulator